jgi:hypothetical protein
VIVTTKNTYEVLSFIRINNVGGRAGQPGRGGLPGTPGLGGGGAGRNGYCGATSGGPSGGSPSPSNLGEGAPAVDGPKGSAIAVIMPSLESLFGT